MKNQMTDPKTTQISEQSLEDLIIAIAKFKDSRGLVIQCSPTYVLNPEFIDKHMPWLYQLEDCVALTSKFPDRWK